MRALKTINFRLLLIISVLGLLISCSTTKKSTTAYESDSDSLSNTDTDFSVSLLKFIETVDLDKLCYPVKLYVIFSVDSTGKIYDSDFNPTILADENCKPDTVYINTATIPLNTEMNDKD